MEKFQLFLVGLLVLVFIYIHTFGNYFFVLNLNWGIKIPRGNLLYYTTTGPSFNGDGDRYGVIKYRTTRKIKDALSWTLEKNSLVEERVNQSLSNLEILEKYNLNFQKEYWYYIQTEDDLSTIYVIYFSDEKMIYIVENIL